MMYHLALGIEYAGTRLSGTQAQRDQRTVQVELAHAISQVAAEQVPIRLSSRTDSGVHATSQVVGFHSSSFRNPYNWRNGINNYLPDDIAVHTVLPVDQEFDPRRSAWWRRYLYVWGECEHKPAIGRDLASWVAPGLQTVEMDSQARSLLGEHDFSSFRGAHCQSKSPRRCVHAISVSRSGSYVIFDITANAFLLRMVRNIAGALLNVGRGSGLNLSRLLACRDRTQAPSTAPATGVYLAQICYQDYPELSKLHMPRIIGSKVKLNEWKADDFVNVREHIESHETLAE